MHFQYIIHFYNLYHVRINEDISINNIFKLSIIYSVYKFQIFLQNMSYLLYNIWVKLIRIYVYSTISIAKE